MDYNDNMKKEYVTYKKILTELNIHFVFCTKFRRKIFKTMKGAEECFRNAALAEFENLGVTPIEIKCKDEYVHIYAQCPPSISTSKILTSVKRTTSAALKDEILKLGEHASVWTWDALVATDATFEESDIEKYVAMQKTRMS